jgi:putative tryptophan/tyrosine transport system substrate-binding protein
MEIFMDTIFKFTNLFLFTLCFLIPSVHRAYPSLPPLKVAVIQIIEHPALNATRQGIYDELKTQGYNEKTNLTWTYQCAQGKPSMAAQISHRLVSNRPDVIVGIGTAAAQAAMQATRGTEIPVIFSSITDPLRAHLVKDLNHPQDNVTGVSNFINVKPQLELFKQLLPRLKRLGMIYNPGEDNSVSILQKVKESASDLNITIIPQAAQQTSEVVGAARFLIGMVDALFISNDNTALAAFGSISRAAEKHKLPVFSSDADSIKQGALAVLGPNQYELGKQTARLLLKVLQDKQHLPPVEFPQKIDLLVNSEMAKKLKINVPADLMKKSLPSKGPE